MEHPRSLKEIVHVPTISVLELFLYHPLGYAYGPMLLELMGICADVQKIKLVLRDAVSNSALQKLYMFSGNIFPYIHGCCHNVYKWSLWMRVINKPHFLFFVEKLQSMRTKLCLRPAPRLEKSECLLEMS
jgi:hypothetical protein